MMIDDGGSTRIKQLKNDVKMDDLLGKVVAGVSVYQDTGSDPFVVNPQAVPLVFKCNMKVRMHQEDGDQTILPPASPGGSSGKDLAPDDRIIIESENGQFVKLSFNAAFRVVIKLEASSSPANIEPIVEAKQHKRQRRYVVSNAGPIKTVTHVTAGGVSTVLFDNPSLGTQGSVYTMIHLK